MTHEAPGGAGEGSERSETGSVTEEAAKLFSALHDWANESGVAEAGGAAQGLLGGLRAAGDHVGHGEDCRYCPVCQAIRKVRETSPEVREHLAEALGSLAQAATVALRQGGPGREPTRPASTPSKIDLDETDDA